MTTVVHLLGSLDPGGAETRTLELLRRRDLTDEQHIFITLSGRRGALAPKFEAIGCKVEPRRLSPTFGPWFIEYLRSVSATHVHSHVHLASGYFLALAWIAGTQRRIAHIRTSADGRPGGLLRSAKRLVGRGLLVACATDVVAVSHAAAHATLGSAFSGRRVRVIYGQIDSSRFPPVRYQPHPQVRLIMVGRLDSGKNPERAIALVARLRARLGSDTDVTLNLVGRCADYDRLGLGALALRLGVADKVHFVGESHEVPRLLVEHDLLISTTTREGLSGVVIEASAAGIPAIVSAIPPNEEVALVLDGVIPIPLAATDDVWCDVIIDVLDQRGDRFHPDRLRAEFEQSPFTLRNTPEIDSLWR